MKVKLLQKWIGKPIGAEIELGDAKARRLIKTGLVECLTVPSKPKVAKRKVKTNGYMDNKNQ